MTQYRQFKVSTQSDSGDRLALLGRRFINFLISFNFARDQHRAEHGTDKAEPESRRELLNVEQQRRTEAARVTAADAQVKEAVKKDLHSVIYAQVEQRLGDQRYLKERLLGLTAEAPQLLDALHASSVSRRDVETFAAGLDWLHEGLLSVVNQPPFASPNDGSRSEITSFRSAVNFVGTNDLKLIVPALTMQHWLPPAEAPFTLLRRKLWKHVMSTGLVSQRLAELEGTLDPAVAFASGIFHEMGKVVLARLYLDIFDEERSAMLKALREDRQTQRYNALSECTPDQQFLRDLMLQKERVVTNDLFAGMTMQRLPLADIYADFARATSVQDVSGYARLLYQANTYSEFVMLHKANLATLDDGKQMFIAAGLTASTVAELRKLDLKRLRLTRH
ncbi:HDOD domain-containing protein [Aliidiomarina sp. Khilg15.8]